jgi:hypothetical protein
LPKIPTKHPKTAKKQPLYEPKPLKNDKNAPQRQKNTKKRYYKHKINYLCVVKSDNGKVNI